MSMSQSLRIRFVQSFPYTASSTGSAQRGGMRSNPGETCQSTTIARPGIPWGPAINPYLLVGRGGWRPAERGPAQAVA
jgi:hypothetical protein